MARQSRTARPTFVVRGDLAIFVWWVRVGAVQLLWTLAVGPSGI